MIIDDRLIIPTLEDILRENSDRFKPILGMDSDDEIRPESVAGQIVSINSTQEYEIFLSFQALLSQLNPLTATGGSLDLFAKFRGLTRKENETDEELRYRITGINPTDQNIHRKFDLLETKLNDLPTVKSARVSYVNGATKAYLVGGEDFNIGETLRDYAPIGVTVGNVSVDIGCSTYAFSRGHQKIIFIEMELVALSGSCGCSSDNIEGAKDVIVENACLYEGGTTIRSEHIGQMLASAGYYAKNVKFQYVITPQTKFDVNDNEDICLDDQNYSNIFNETRFDNPLISEKTDNLEVPFDILPTFCKDGIDARLIDA